MFAYYLISYTAVTYDDYVYPDWAEGMGLCISFSSMIWVPAYFIYYLATGPGTIRYEFRPTQNGYSKLGTYPRLYCSNQTLTFFFLSMTVAYSDSPGRAKPVLPGPTTQSLTCSIMDKPHTARGVRSFARFRR